MTPADHNPFIEMVDAIKFLEGAEKPKVTREFWETLQNYLIAPELSTFSQWHNLLDVCDKMLEA